MAVTGLKLSYWSSILICWIILVFTEKEVFANVPNPPTLVHRRFEYKYSFKPPYLAQRDGTVPFWEYGGNAIASAESVRVAPSLRSQKGAIWTKTKTNFDWWDVEIIFRVTGRGRIGADGLAFWYTQDKGDYNGAVFGSSDQWTGLGLFFDSFDNDNKHNNPYIMAVLNDGTKQFDHQNDGTVQLLSGCLRDFRNKPYPTRARIEYYNNILTVLFHNGMTNNNDGYELCLRADGVQLPKNGYFGVSAATGGLADDHDVYQFLTTSLHQPGQFAQQAGTGEAAEKLTQEFKEYQDKLEKQKQEYRKEHPDEVKHEDEWEEFYESDNQRELRQIWQAQSQISDTLRDLSRKMDEMIGRQENTLSLVSRGFSVPQTGQQQPPAIHTATTGGSISRVDIDILFKNQNLLITSLGEVSSVLRDVQHKVASATNQGVPFDPTRGSSGVDTHAILNEVRDGLRQIRQETPQAGQRLVSSKDCSPCVGTTMFLSVTAVQLLLVFLYNILKNRSDAQAKKFY